MHHNDFRSIPWTMLQPGSFEEATILTGNQPPEEIDTKQASEGATAQKIMPSEIRDPRLDKGECSCLTFFARMVIWGSRNS
jgi:hypothetical protein